MVFKLVIVRHGESEWNKENRFTGWTDVGLSENGLKEAVEAGNMLKAAKFKFDIVFTSVLKRAIHTTWSILMAMDNLNCKITNSWRLNERHYGSLQGLNKSETALKFGEDQVKIWRRSFDISPPALNTADMRWPGNDNSYSNIPVTCLPFSESLKNTVDRVKPYWEDKIAPAILSNKQVLVSAHGNSLRALIMFLDNMTEEEILSLNLPTACPLVYELDDKLKPIKKYYLIDEDELKKRIEAVASQGTVK